MDGVAGVGSGGSLLAISDLHVRHPDNRTVVEGLHPESPDDWLLVAGDVGDTVADIEWTLRLLADRFAKVVWSPGNHELWTPPGDPVTLRGAARYAHLVDLCRDLGVITPEDPYPVWAGPAGPVTVAPLFLLYDHSWRPEGFDTQEAALAEAYRTGIVCTDEYLLHPDPYESRSAWCAARVAETARRLADRDPALPTVLVNHWPLVREPTRILRYPIFAQWCGTEATADWHRRFDAVAVVYGHLHIPRTTWYDGVRFEEVSVGYPREWRRRRVPPGQLRRILPAPDHVPPTAW
ncbi:metallophosphoesterase [Micromonospora sp. WMMA1363]|uniref:metallophosphoesterase family protein n=1 Tax=Micromonospora sp. WMMA1363 TaxID=3053985 RepID=UPI00259C9709|nr:metallophosphoesterase [Micromonospora sp. WMMA1363]MDM4718769.1 metallophosphoesterase [Micromonospora sp. WMMA1363]